MAIDPKNAPPCSYRGEAAAEPAKGGRAAPSAVLGEGQRGRDSRAATFADPFVRAENEDDDGYDPYSDRPAEREPLFSEDPWN